jgi:hypothetical protein
MAKRNKFKGMEPVDEQTRKFKFGLETITEKGQVVGRVYRRQPLFETMYVRGEITREELQALRYYRERYELSHRSLMRSCLAPTIRVRNHGGGLSPLSSRAAQEVEIMEAAAGLFLPALRALAIGDMSFNKIAIERYGSQQIQINGKTRIVPRSKQHSRKVKSDFFAALKCFLPVAQSFFVSNFSVDLTTHTGHKSFKSGNAFISPSA